MCLLTINSAWMSVIIAALSLGVSIWAIISARRSNKRVEEINNNSIRLKYRPVIDMENGWSADPVQASITFNIIANDNEAKLTKIVLITDRFVCSQPRSFPIRLPVGEVELFNFICYRQEDYHSATLSVDIYYEDIAGNMYKTHIEGNQSGLRSNPAQFLS